eukprot:1449063-Amphidinium_carterae.2
MLAVKQFYTTAKWGWKVSLGGMGFGIMIRLKSLLPRVYFESSKSYGAALAQFHDPSRAVLRAIVTNEHRKMPGQATTSKVLQALPLLEARRASAARSCNMD